MEKEISIFIIFGVLLNIIPDAAAQRLAILEDHAGQTLKFAYAPGSYSNIVTRKKRYLGFCTWFELKPFPVTQWQLVRFAIFLSLIFTSVQSIKNYCATICIINELNGFAEVIKGKLYKKIIDGIRRQLKHKVKRARPITKEMLIKIQPWVNQKSRKQVAIWVAILFGFHLFLRKCNLVPDNRKHNPRFQLSRRDLRYKKGVMLAHIKWSKTDQYGEAPLNLPMVRNTKSLICPVSWCLFMIKRMPAASKHNLFCYYLNRKVIPITYKDLTLQLRAWLRNIGVKNPNEFSSHSLRRGGATHAFRNGVPDLTIKTLGAWASSAYKRYIDENLETRLKAWLIFNRD